MVIQWDGPGGTAHCREWTTCVVMFESQVNLRDRSTKTSWAACLDSQTTLESTLGSVFLRVSTALCPAIWPSVRVLIGFDSVGSQGISEAEPSADQRADVTQYSVRRPRTTSHPYVSISENSNFADLVCRDV